MQLVVIESMKASIRQIFHERIVADITLRFVTMMVGMVGCALVFPNNKDTSNTSTEYCGTACRASDERCICFMLPDRDCLF